MPDQRDRLRPGPGARLGDARGGRGRRATPTCYAAARAMGGRGAATSTGPTRRRAEAYDGSTPSTRTLHDYFGRGVNDVMHRLHALRERGPMPRERRGPRPMTPRRSTRSARDVARAARASCCATGLVAWTAGNVSARVPGADLFVIKPSGVDYDELTPRVDGRLSTSTATSSRASSSPVERHRAARLRLPRTCRTSAASCTPTPPTRRRGRPAGEPIPCVLTAMADEFGGEIPVGPFARIGDEEIGARHRRDARRAAARRRC